MKFYYLNNEGKPFSINSPQEDLTELTKEEYKEACEEWNDAIPDEPPPPGPSFEEQVRAVVLQMIEDGIVKEGSEYEPPED